MSITKHIGHVKNTAATCVVVIPYLPEEPENCLIVESDSLPPRYQDSFALLLRGEAQSTNEPLADLLGRRLFADGGSMLTTLHNNGYIKKAKVDSIIMKTVHGKTMPLADIVAAMRVAKGEESPANPKGGSDETPEATLLATVQALAETVKTLTTKVDELTKPATKPRRKPAAKKPAAKVKA